MMILCLAEYDDLYLNQLKNSIAYCVTRIPCPPKGYCNPSCGLQRFCKLLQTAYSEVCEEESRRHGTKA